MSEWLCYIPAFAQPKNQRIWQQDRRLSKRLQQAQAHKDIPLSFEQRLVQWLAWPQPQLPVADLVCHMQGITRAQDYPYRYAIFPLTLQADFSGVFVTHYHQVIPDDEQTALIATLNDLLAAYQMRLLVVAGMQWILESKHPLVEMAWPISEAIGRNLALSKQDTSTQAWLTEIQMALYQHPVNAARRVQQLPEINSVWIWGGGECVPPYTPPIAWAVSDHIFVQAVCAYLQVPCYSTQAFASLSDAQLGQGNGMLVVDALLYGQHYGDGAYLAQFIAQQLYPLIKQFPRYTKQLSLYVDGATSYTLRRADALCVWRQFLGRPICGK